MSLRQFFKSFFGPREEEPHRHDYVNTHEVRGRDRWPRYKNERSGCKETYYALRYCPKCEEMIWLHLSYRYIAEEVPDDIRTEEA
jgi:hypothetical protein